MGNSHAYSLAYHETHSGLDRAVVEIMTNTVKANSSKPYDEKNVIVALVRGRFSSQMINKHLEQVLQKVSIA